MYLDMKMKLKLNFNLNFSLFFVFLFFRRIVHINREVIRKFKKSNFKFTLSANLLCRVFHSEMKSKFIFYFDLAVVATAAVTGALNFEFSCEREMMMRVQSKLSHRPKIQRVNSLNSLNTHQCVIVYMRETVCFQSV